MNIDNKSLEPCGCCKGISELASRDVSNAAGQNALQYRVGTHGSFKNAMLSRLSLSPGLKRLTVRESDDPVIALIDGWATVLDVLTFYNERIINEGFLRTAGERLSLYELSKHLNYHPKPGVAASTWLSFTMDDSRGAPTEAFIPKGAKVQSIPAQGENPQIFETVEAIEAKTKWNAIRPKHYELQQLKMGATRLYLKGTNTQLQPGGQILIVGDERIIDEDGKSERWDIRTVQTVVPNNEEQYTVISWQEGLGQDPDTAPAQENPKVYVFRQRAAFFGHNAPDFRNMPEEFKKSYYNPYNSKVHKDWGLSIKKSKADKIIHLDAAYPKILEGSWLALAQPKYVELYKAVQVKLDARTDYSLTSKTTQIELDTNINLPKFPLRETVALAQSEELPMAQAPILSPIFGNLIELDGSYPELKKGQKLIISGELLEYVQVTERFKMIKTRKGEERQEDKLCIISRKEKRKLKAGDILKIVEPPEFVGENQKRIKWKLKTSDGFIGDVECDTEVLLPYEEGKIVGILELPTSLNRPVITSEVVEVFDNQSGSKNTSIRLNDSLNHTYKRETLEINANVASATHGGTKFEVLGSGDGAQVFQQFKLKQKPLTHIAAPTISGIESTLEIRVNDIKWQEVASLHGTAPDDRVFITRRDEDGTVTVQFGNGITGARLPSGTENIRAEYRLGTGFEGRLKADQLSLLLSPQLGVKSVVNPLSTTGSEGSESMENIRQNAPMHVFTLNRIISVKDYEHFANAFPGIGKARADFVWRGHEQFVHLTVAAADEGAVDTDLKEGLITAMDTARDKNFPLFVQSFAEKPFALEVSIKIASDYLAEKVFPQVRETLLRAFSFHARHFGQEVAVGELLVVIQSVEGVLAVDLDKLGTVEEPIAKKHFSLSAAVASYDEHETEFKPAELLLIDPNIEISEWKHENRHEISL